MPVRWMADQDRIDTQLFKKLSNPSDAVTHDDESFCWDVCSRK